MKSERRKDQMKFKANFTRTSTVEIEAKDIDEATEKAFQLSDEEIGEWSENWNPESVEIK
jgi:hypothetical protein